MTGPVQLIALTEGEAHELVTQLARAALRLQEAGDHDGATEATLAAQRLRERIERPAWMAEQAQWNSSTAGGQA